VRVLITRLSAFGDIVHAWPLAAALARPAPATVAWLVEEPFLPLVQGHPGVARTITVATRRWRRAPLARRTRAEVRRAISEIAEFAPEVALDPQGLVKSAVWASLAGVPRRVGLAATHRRERLAGAFYTETVAPPAEARHVVDATLSLLGALGRPAPTDAVPDGRFLLAAGPPGGGGGRTVALLPAAGRPGKCWPAGRWAELARAAAGAGWRPLLVVGPDEDALARRIAAAAGSAADVAPPTSLRELAALLATCAAAVGGDTGPVHLAAALGTPTVALYLTTDPGRNGPRGTRVNVVTAARTGATSGRARTGSAGEISVAAVVAALEALRR